MVLLRQEIGDVLRDTRREQGRTLRDVSGAARVSLGYLSEVERGQKEASSELLTSICDALSVPLSSVLHRVSQRLAVAEGLGAGLSEVCVPDTPAELAGTGGLGNLPLDESKLFAESEIAEGVSMDVNLKVGPNRPVRGQGLVSVA